MLKKRPRDILDIQSCTFDSKHTKKEITRLEIQKQLVNDRALQESLLKEKRINLSKINTSIFDEQDEEKTLKEIKQKEKELAESKRQEKLIDIERLAALEKLELEKIAHEKRKLHILQNSEEFQEFKRQLRRAQTAKEQLDQIIQNQIEKNLTKVKEKEEQQHEMDREREFLQLMKEQQWQMKDMQKKNLQFSLLKQMEEKAFKKQSQDYHEKQSERAYIENVIDDIQHEEKRSLERKLAKRRQVQKTFEDYWLMRDKLREKERKVEMMESKRMQEYFRQQQARDKMFQDAQAERLNRLEELKDKLALVLIEERQRKEMMEQRLLENQAKDYEEKYRRREKEMLQFENQKRISARSSIMRQMQQREERLYQDLAEEERYRQKVNKELTKDHIRKQIYRHQNEKQLEYLKELQRMMKEMKMRKTDEKLTNEEFLKELEEQEKMTKTVVQSEKEKILKEKLAEMHGHLPNKMLKSFAYDQLSLI